MALPPEYRTNARLLADEEEATRLEKLIDAKIVDPDYTINSIQVSVKAGRDVSNVLDILKTRYSPGWDIRNFDGLIELVPQGRRSPIEELRAWKKRHADHRGWIG